MLQKLCIVFCMFLVLLFVNCPVTPVDSDGDGITDDVDNCIDIENPEQLDKDIDGVGDLCDNCIDVYNPLQEDLNNNNIGDACEEIIPVDTDEDGVPDDIDNCIFDFNPLQEDCDSNGIGDACDPGSCGPIELNAPVISASDAVSQSNPNIDEKGAHWDQTEIRITWDSVPGAEYYRVYRCDADNCSAGPYEQIGGDVYGVSYSDAAVIEFNQDCCSTPPCSDCSIDLADDNGDEEPNDGVMGTDAWYTKIKTGIDWGKISPVQPKGAMKDDYRLKIERTYSYRVKAFNAAGESPFSNTDEGSRLPAHSEFRSELISNEGLVFLNRNFCCNNDPYLTDQMRFEGDIAGTAELIIENKTDPVRNHQRFNNYQNLVLVFNGGVDGALDTAGYGWQTGTILYSGLFKGEMDYNLHYSAKWADWGIYTVRYEGESRDYYHPANAPTKPTESDCNSFGIPFGADYDALEGDCM